MIFGAKTLYSANANIDALFENGDLGDRTGAISLVQKEGRKTINSGKIFFRKNFIYAVEIDNLDIPIGKRVATGGLVDYQELQEVCRTAESFSSQRVVDLLLERQLISEKQLNIYIKEHFLGLMEEILSWDNCEGTWIPEVSTKNFVMPYVPIQKIRSIIDNRKKYRNGFTKSVQGFFAKEEIRNLTFVAVKKDVEDLNAEFSAVFNLATGEYTVDKIAEETGLNIFNTLQVVVSLWQEGHLDIQLGGIKLPYASLIKKVNAEQEKPKEDYKEEIIPLETPVEEAVVSEESEDNHDEEIILHGENNHAVDYTLPNSTVDVSAEKDETVVENGDSSISEDPANYADDEFLQAVDSPERQEDVQEDEEYLVLLEETPSHEKKELFADDETPYDENYDSLTENEKSDTGDYEFEEAMAEPAEYPASEPAREVEMADESVESEELNELDIKESMSTPNKTLRAGKLQELTLKLTSLQGNVEELEERAVSSEAAWREAQENVTRLENELSQARELSDALKEAHDNIANDYDTACNEVSELLASFQIGG